MMYQLSQQLTRQFRGEPADVRHPAPNGRNAAAGGTDMITAFSNGLSGIAASPAPAMAPQSWPMNTSRPVGPGRVQHPQRVVHQRADVVAAVRRQR